MKYKIGDTIVDLDDVSAIPKEFPKDAYNVDVFMYLKTGGKVTATISVNHNNPDEIPVSQSSPYRHAFLKRWKQEVADLKKAFEEN